MEGRTDLYHGGLPLNNSCPYPALYGGTSRSHLRSRWHGADAVEPHHSNFECGPYTHSRDLNVVVWE